MSRYDLALHVSKADGSLAVALRNAINYSQALPDGGYHMVLVVNAAAVRQLAADNTEVRDALEKACAQGLSVRVCNNALREQGVRPESLFPQCEVVPAGVVEIVNLQQDGYSYIKA